MQCQIGIAAQIELKQRMPPSNFLLTARGLLVRD